MEIFGFEVGEILTRSTVYFFITFFIGVFLLHFATKILDFKNRSIGKAIEVIVVGDIVAFFLAFIPYIGRIVGLIGFWFFIKSFYDVSWGKAILAWIMSILVAFIIAAAVLILFDISILFIPKL